MIDWTNIIVSIVIGFLTGVFSSLIVTIFWDKKTKKEATLLKDKMQENQFKDNFNNDIQAMCKYLNRLQLELGFENLENVLRIFEERPTTKSFKNGMNERGKEILRELYSVQSDIKKAVSKQDLTKIECKKFMSLLLKIECDLLREPTAIRKSWEEYKKEEKTI